MSIKKIISGVTALAVALSSFAVVFAQEAADAVPSVKTILVNGQVFPEKPFPWEIDLLGGFPRAVYQPQNLHQPESLGTLSKFPQISVGEGRTLGIEVFDETDRQVFAGTGAQFAGFSVQKNGTYRLVITESTGGSKERAHFCFTVNIKLVPQIALNAASVVQGDVLKIRVTNVPAGIVPKATTDLGMAVFTKKDGAYEAFVPVGFLKPVGSYKVTVRAGDTVSETIVKVTAGNFKKQYLTINTKNPVISEASSPKAYKQYRDAIYPLFKTADETRYWTGAFTQPVKGRISTEYGLLRYTNGSSKPSGHGGVDIAAPAGTTVVAPAAGRVVYSNYLLNTGNTIVIEHGGGLKTYYYHLNGRSVYQGNMVKQGQKIGVVGSTGYSTGAHLHFEMKIGDQAINPWNLINGKGGFFSQ